MSGSGNEDIIISDAPQVSPQAFDPYGPPITEPAYPDDDVASTDFQHNFRQPPAQPLTEETVPGAGSGQTVNPLPASTGLGPFTGTNGLAFIVETGVGISNATSYIELVDATAYISANVHAAPQWNSIDPADQMSLLMWATRYLDQRTRWYGEPAAYGQALGWPRQWAVDRDGLHIPHNVVPKLVRDATAEMARYLVAQDRSIERAQDEFTKIEVDVIRLYRDATYRLPAVPVQIQYMLRGLGGISSGRNNAVKIRTA